MSVTARALILRDLRLAWRLRGQAVLPLVFFTLVATLFPLGLNPDPTFLRAAAPGLLMIAALLAALLPSEKIFEDDLRDGTLDALYAGGMGLALYAAARIFSAWLIHALPMVVASPLLAIMLGMEAKDALTAPLTLLPATALLLLTGAIGAALSAGARSGTMLLALLVLPLYIPVLIFGAGAISGYNSALLFLLAILSLALPLAPLACGAILRAQYWS